MKSIYLIGPDNQLKAGVGEILARDLGLQFVDLDREFLAQFGNLSDYVKQYGYEMYAYENSKLFYELIIKHGKKGVYSLSPAFLMYKNLKELVQDHLTSIKQGVSVLLLPQDADPAAIQEGLVAEKSGKYEINYDDYKKFGDLQITSNRQYAQTAEEIQTKIANLG